MFQRWFARRKSEQRAAPAGDLLFLCEHDGEPERNLKRSLAAMFHTRADVEAAYLAIVQYPGAPSRNVALCVTGVPDSQRLDFVKAVGVLFADLFSLEQHLDVLFPTSPQKVHLQRVCRPFFTRGAA